MTTHRTKPACFYDPALYIWYLGLLFIKGLQIIVHIQLISVLKNGVAVRSDHSTTLCLSANSLWTTVDHTIHTSFFLQLSFLLSRNDETDFWSCFKSLIKQYWRPLFHILYISFLCSNFFFHISLFKNSGFLLKEVRSWKPYRYHSNYIWCK